MEKGEKIKVNIGGKTLNVEVAYTDQEKEKGLSNRDSLSPDSGMLFVWDSPQPVSMWMKDTKIPLDIIFIDEELVVIAVYQGIPLSEEELTEENVSFVLETNVDSGIKKGDELEFSPDSQVNKEKMVVLNENGKPQMELDGGERIFSRPDTKILIKFSKKAQATKRDNDYKALGKRVFKFLNQQDSRPKEYVKE